MSDHQSSRNPLRTGFGVLLFIVWGVETVIWVASTVDLVGKGHPAAAITAVLTLSLMVLLAGMEGLEVAVIDKWRDLFPGKTVSALASWLSARQLFVALIVTGATLLSRRSTLVVPFTSHQISGGLWAGVFDLTWTGLTVLWFAQILPKALAATDPARYLRLLRKPLFPLVAFIRAIGVSQPGEWAASWIGRRMGWVPPEEPLKPAALPPAEQLLASGWRAVITPERPEERSGRHDSTSGQGTDK